MKLKILIHPADEGGFWAEVPALPGCVSEGDTLAETLANIREAAQGWLAVAADRILAAPLPQTQVMEIEL
ncbi:MAG: type II toxin-antitoxin system HicB family antitoxin [Acidobacteria bacterium]|nr:type II toxin-antitoxin system HicB family antitoxin [Acidobacteriota bacterium]MBI3427090.1 type II toxin-antitoxin system HicB family antitoxin [Acidobacteriota bacterium]